MAQARIRWTERSAIGRDNHANPTCKLDKDFSVDIGINAYPFLHLQIIDRLPLSLEKLKQSKLGKLIMKLTKDHPTPGELNFLSLRYAKLSSQEHRECYAVVSVRQREKKAHWLRRTVAAPESAVVAMYMYLTTVSPYASGLETNQRSRIWL